MSIVHWIHLEIIPFMQIQWAQIYNEIPKSNHT